MPASDDAPGPVPAPEGGAGASATGGDASIPDPVTASVVLGLAVGVFGISFGVLAVASGLSPAQACVMSLLVFTGASQFAVVGVVGAGGSTATALGSALLLAARNAAYGVAMADVIRGRLPTRLVGAQLVIDESTAMASAQRDPADRRRGFWIAGASVFVFWNLGTLLGALGGDAIGDPERYGLDAAFPAGFVALVVPHLAKADGRWAAAVGVAVALLLVPVAPAGVPVLAAALAVLVGLRRPGPPGGDTAEGASPTGIDPALPDGEAP